jgi:hypothetical protein
MTLTVNDAVVQSLQNIRNRVPERCRILACMRHGRQPPGGAAPTAAPSKLACMTADRRNDVIRVVGAGVGAPLALAIAAWPHAVVVSVAIGLIGAVSGVLFAFGVEHLLDRRAELQRLRSRVTEVEAEIENVRKLNKLLEYQTRVAQAEAGINAIWMEVYGRALQEAAKTGSVLPMDAILARVQVMQKAKGLDRPIPPPSVTQQLPGV